MVRCTAVHLIGGKGHEHISEIRWVNPQTNATGQTSRAGMVDFVHKNPNAAYCQDVFGKRAYLRVNKSILGTLYVQTYADGIWTDNLLALPRY